MIRHVFQRLPDGRDHQVDVHDAWTRAEVMAALHQIFEDWAAILPRDPDARIVVKPNLNNDLCALTGNCTDLRVLAGILEEFSARGYQRVTIADGSNVGIDRRQIDTFKRLRVDELARRYGASVVNLNTAPGSRIELEAHGRPSVATLIQEADFLLSVPKLKTHSEAVFTSAMKNWVGLCRGQDKRHMHYDLPANIVALNRYIRPHLVIVDGLVGMEGNGPGDGIPYRFGHLLVTDNTALSDLVACRLLALPWRKVPYLPLAEKAGFFDESTVAEVLRSFPVLRPVLLAPERSLLNRIASSPKSIWVKPAIRLVSDSALGTDLAYRFKIIQDVYNTEDDTLRVVGRDPGDCGECNRCAEFCPTGLSREEIGVETSFPKCIQCLYCWFVCPRESVRITGEARAMQRQIDRYRASILAL